MGYSLLVHQRSEHHCKFWTSSSRTCNEKRLRFDTRTSLEMRLFRCMTDFSLAGVFKDIWMGVVYACILRVRPCKNIAVVSASELRTQELWYMSSTYRFMFVWIWEEQGIFAGQNEEKSVVTWVELARSNTRTVLDRDSNKYKAVLLNFKSSRWFQINDQE